MRFLPHSIEQWHAVINAVLTVAAFSPLTVQTSEVAMMEIDGGTPKIGEEPSDEEMATST